MIIDWKFKGFDIPSPAYFQGKLTPKIIPMRGIALQDVRAHEENDDYKDDDQCSDDTDRSDANHF